MSMTAVEVIKMCFDGKSISED